MFKLLGLVFFIAIVFAVGAYFAGWIRFNSTVDKTTIDVETDKMKEAGERAIESGKKAVKSIKNTFSDSESKNKEQEQESKSGAGDKKKASSKELQSSKA